MSATTASPLPIELATLALLEASCNTLLSDPNPSMHALADCWYQHEELAQEFYSTEHWPLIASRAACLLAHCRITQRLTSDQDAGILMSSFLEF